MKINPGNWARSDRLTFDACCGFLFGNIFYFQDMGGGFIIISKPSNLPNWACEIRSKVPNMHELGLIAVCMHGLIKNGNFGVFL